MLYWMIWVLCLNVHGCGSGCFWVSVAYQFGCVWITLRTLLGAIHIFKKENVCGKEEHSCRDFAVADLMGCH